MTNLETKCAWDAYSEYFEYYAAECEDSWLMLSKIIFTEDHGAEECAKIDWKYIEKKLGL